jgi:tetratricopeptide (TPR) repeat protein
MDPIQDLLQRLRETQGDARAQAALTAGFLVLARPNEEREPLRAALDAAAVLHWFDAELLGKVLAIPDEDSRIWSQTLKKHSFVEHYRGESDLHYNLHESTRLGWRIRFASERPKRFRDLSLRASSCFADDPTPGGRIEWIYHLLCGNPELAAAELEKLDREWSGSARPEHRSALAAALQELVDTDLVKGRARAWSLLTVGWTRDARGETAQLAELAAEAFRLACEAGDKSAEADAKCLVGDVLLIRGKLDAAQKAYHEFLSLRRHLAEQDPNDADWQRELTMALSRVGHVLHAQGNLTAAQAAFEEDLAISRRLAEQDPSNAGWQRDLAVAYRLVGGVLEAQDQLAAARAAFEQDLSISRRLVEQAPSNAGWQRDLALACLRMGRIAAAANLNDICLQLYEESLRIFAELVKIVPGLVQWAEDKKVVEAELTALRATIASSPDGAADRGQTS